MTQKKAAAPGAKASSTRDAAPVRQRPQNRGRQRDRYTDGARRRRQRQRKQVPRSLLKYSPYMQKSSAVKRRVRSPRRRDPAAPQQTTATEKQAGGQGEWYGESSAHGTPAPEVELEDSV